jgi:hypothetical protein
MATPADDIPFTTDPEELVGYLIERAGSYTVDQMDKALGRVGRNNGPFVLAELW